MTEIHHSEVSRDCLYDEVSQNLEAIYAIWENGQVNLRFTIPVLCAVKLETFINVAGKLHVEDWERSERKLSFKVKCEKVCGVLGLVFDAKTEPNKAAIETFEIRNSLVHPQMHIEQTDERINYAEYERRRNMIPGVEHPLRSRLTPEVVRATKTACDAFVNEWGRTFLKGQPEYWLGWGSTGGFTWEGPNGG